MTSGFVFVIFLLKRHAPLSVKVHRTSGDNNAVTLIEKGCHSEGVKRPWESVSLKRITDCRVPKGARNGRVFDTVNLLQKQTPALQCRNQHYARSRSAAIYKIVPEQMLRHDLQTILFCSIPTMDIEPIFYSQISFSVRLVLSQTKVLTS